MQTETVSVRPASHADFSAIAELLGCTQAQHHRWHPDEFRPAFLGFTPAIFQTWLEQPDQLHLAAEIDGKVAGYAGAARWAGHGSDTTFVRRGVFVSFVRVAPDQRRKGVGRALLAGIETWAAEFDAEYVSLSVSACNKTAQAFYSTLGYDLSTEHRTKTLRKVRRIETAP